MGVYGMSRRVLERYSEGTAMGFDTLMLDQLSLGRSPRSFSFNGYWLDIGRPDDYDRANDEFAQRRSQLLPSRAPALALLDGSLDAAPSSIPMQQVQVAIPVPVPVPVPVRAPAQR
jgi:NDP-sugar pyrophosphorylase family protein